MKLVRPVVPPLLFETMVQVPVPPVWVMVALAPKTDPMRATKSPGTGAVPGAAGMPELVHPVSGTLKLVVPVPAVAAEEAHRGLTPAVTFVPCSVGLHTALDGYLLGIAIADRGWVVPPGPRTTG